MVKMLKQIISISLAAALLIPSGWLIPSANAADAGETTVYHETFANGTGAAIQAGGASLTHVTGQPFEGNDDGAALYVSNRKDDWDAADFNFADIRLEDGKTYTVTVSVYVDAKESVPAGAQAYLQTVDSYALLASANYEAGKAITLTKEFTVDTSKDTRLRVQSNPNGKSVPFYIGDVLIKTSDGGSQPPRPPRPPALEFTTITFEDQTTGGFTGRSGTETLTVTNETNHTDNGSYALKIEGRTEAWHGPSMRVEKYIDEGVEYKISAWVKLIEPSSAQLRLSTQIGNDSPQYLSLSSKTISPSEGWVLLEGSYRYDNASSEYVTIYVESANSTTASFYIDDIRFESMDSGPIEIQKDLIPLKDAYASDFLIGNVISSSDLDGVRYELLKMHHNAVTAENAMKPDAMQPEKGVFTFDAVDHMLNKILAEGMKMHGHVLVWHQQSPAWMNTMQDAQGNTVPLSREEALINLRAHIKTVMEHFGDKVISWDVVNEAMNDNPSNPTDWQGALRKAPWYSAIGPDYVEQAFLAAREVLDAHPDWDIKLYYNDYNDDNQNKATAIYSMVKEINEKYAQTHPGKLLIDGVGMQAHYNTNTNPANVRLSLERFISLGVEVSITELDISAGQDHQLPEELAIRQGYLYAQLFDLYKEYADHIARVTFWGLDDSSSWRSESNPLLFDKRLQAKPAYYAVIDPDKFLQEHKPDTSDANQTTAAYATPVIDGLIDAIWNDTPAVPINRYQMAWQGATGTSKALWDAEHLYVLIQVNDAQLDKTAANEWEQDSVEIFLDQNNEKTTFYQDDDGQYRVNFDNETSFSPPSLEQGFVSATKISGTNYTVEVKIPLTHITPAKNMKLGFDVQINDAKDGARQSVSAWNDTTGNGYQDTSVYGVLTLIDKATNPGGNNGGSNGGGGVPGTPTTPSSGNVEVKDGVVIIKPEVKIEGGRVTGIISEELLKRALELAAASGNGHKQLIIDLLKLADASSYELQLPTQSLQSKDPLHLLLKTDQATMEIPSTLLSNASVDTKTVSIRIGQASADQLKADARKQIGNRPIQTLSIAAGDKVIAWNNSNAPITISIPYTPTAEELKHPNAIVVWSIASDGSVTAIPNGRYDAAAGAVVFRTTSINTYAIAYVTKTFGDLNSVPWAKQAIEAMAARDMITATATGSFNPEASITRADFAAILVRVLGLQSTNNNSTMFSDVPESAYYYNELVTAKALGIVTGTGDHTFNPNGNISRQDMMVLAARALAAAGMNAQAGGALDAYSDAASVSAYARASVAAMVQAGLVNGKNGQLAPNDSLSKAEAAVILYRIWNL